MKKCCCSKVLISLLVAFLVIGHTGCGKVPEFTYYKELKSPKHLYVIKGNSMNDAECVMIQTLQGVVAQERPEIYIEKNENYKLWLDDLEKNHKVTYEYVDSPWQLVKIFKENLGGFITYELNTDSENVACSISGVLKAIAVDSSLIEEAKKAGLTEQINVIGRDEKWAFDNYKDELNQTIIIQQSEENHALRDYGPAVRALYYYEGLNFDNTYEVFDWLVDDSPTLGWGPHGEEQHVGISSMMHLFTVPSDHAYNLSVFAGVDVKSLKQNHKVNKKLISSKKEDVHYVCIVMSDGDNIQWYLNDFVFDERWYGSSERGTVPMGWSISPSLVDLAPNVMQYVYERKTENDYFVGGVSGNGYFYPNSYGNEALEIHTERMNIYYKKADLQIVSILDSPSSESMEKYATQKNIIGGFYLVGYKYKDGNGAIYWENKKPFVTVKESLWSDTPDNVANRINSYKKDPKSSDGYTLVNVHPWSHTYADVCAMVEKLDESVVVVNPVEFLELIKRNVKEQNQNE